MMVIVADARASRTSSITDQVFWVFDAKRLYQFRDFLSEVSERAKSLLEGNVDRGPIFRHFRDSRDDWIEGDTDIELIVRFSGSHPNDGHELKKLGGVQEKIDIRADMHFHWIDAVWTLPGIERAMEACGSRSAQADLVADWLECEKGFRDVFDPAFEAISSPTYSEYSKPREEYNVLVIECHQQPAAVVTDRGKDTVRVCVDTEPMDAVQVFGGDVLKAALFMTERALCCIEEVTGIALETAWIDLESVKAQASLVDEYLEYKRNRDGVSRHYGTLLGAAMRSDDGALQAVDHFGLFLAMDELALLYSMIDESISCLEMELASRRSSDAMVGSSNFSSSFDLGGCIFDIVVKDTEDAS